MVGTGLDRIEIPDTFWTRPEVTDALTAADFGALFRLLRKYAGTSQTTLATATSLDQGAVSRIMAGKRRITAAHLMARIADGLTMPDHARIRGGIAPTPRQQAAVSHIDQQVMVPVDRPAKSGDNDQSSLATSTVPVAHVVMTEGLINVDSNNFEPAVWVPTSEGIDGRQVGAEVVHYLRDRTARLRRLDDVLGGGDTFLAYSAEFQATHRILRTGRYTDTTRQALLAVLAEQAQQAGWAAFDAGDNLTAARYFRGSHTAATEARDRSLAANAMAFLAYQQVDLNRQEAVNTAAEACSIAREESPAGVRALLYDRLAWANAFAGNVAETQRVLDLALHAVNQADSLPRPDWTTWVDQNEIQIMTGRCWTELRRPLRAVPVLEEALAAFGDGKARDKALYSSWLAEAYLDANEIEQSAATLRRIIELSADVASIRPRQRVARAIRGLAPYAASPSVGEVLDLARDYTRAVSRRSHSA